MRMMRDQASKKLDQSAEQVLKKTIGSPRFTRLKQISYQMQGTSALVTPEVRGKLNIDDDQAQQIQALLGQGGQLRREVRKAEFAYTKAAGPPFPQTGGNNGRPNRDSFRNYFQALQQFREKPEVKAKLDQFAGQSKKIDKQMEHEIGRVLTKRQKANYYKLLGAPFDLDSVRNAWRRGGPAQNKTAETKPAANANEKSAASASQNSDEKNAATEAKPSPAPKSRRKSLRAARGLED